MSKTRNYGSISDGMFNWLGYALEMAFEHGTDWVYCPPSVAKSLAARGLVRYSDPHIQLTEKGIPYAELGMKLRKTGKYWLQPSAHGSYY